MGGEMLQSGRRQCSVPGDVILPGAAMPALPRARRLAGQLWRLCLPLRSRLCVLAVGWWAGLSICL